MINGNSSKCIRVKISKNATFKELIKIIEEKLDWNGVKNIRFFSTQGVEIFEDDLDFLKSGTTLYISQGYFFKALFVKI